MSKLLSPVLFESITIRPRVCIVGGTHSEPEFGPDHRQLEVETIVPHKGRQWFFRDIYLTEWNNFDKWFLEGYLPKMKDTHGAWTEVKLPKVT